MEAEAHLLNGRSGAEAILIYSPTGYVKSNDWGKIDPQLLLKEISSNTEKANHDRITRNISPLHVDGWVQVPTFNTDTHTASWILMSHDDAGDRSLNAVALKLGRYGTERIVLIDKAANLSTAQQNLLLLANAHQFSRNARYEEFQPSVDRAAGYGIAGLVAGVMGVKLVQAIAAGGFLLLLKKLGFMIFLPFIWAGKKLFGRTSRFKVQSTRITSK